jgi:hypothetical protein
MLTTAYDAAVATDENALNRYHSSQLGLGLIE